MCAEKDPIECHRTVLIARHLRSLAIEIKHILADGSLESQEEAVQRLVRRLALPERYMFRTPEDVAEDAYKIQETRIAYRPAEA